MPITINGTGTLAGVSVGGLPDGTVDTDVLAANAVTNAKQAIIKAWCNFKGDGTEAINRSYNIASFTDHAAGDYTFTFSNAMATTNYVVLIHTSRAGDDSLDALSWGAVHGKATGSFGMNITQTNSAFSSTAALSDLAAQVNFVVVE